MARFGRLSIRGGKAPQTQGLGSTGWFLIADFFSPPLPRGERGQKGVVPFPSQSFSLAFFRPVSISPHF